MFHVECLMTCFLWQLKLESIRIGVRYDCSNDMTAKFPFLHFDLTLVLLGRFSIEKKGKISHFWPGPPLEKCETCKRKIFKHELTNVLVKENNSCPNKLQKENNSTLKYPRFFYFQVRWYPLHQRNTLFFADLNELE